MNITIPHEANASELAMKLSGAVHGVGGPPATLQCGGGAKFEIDALAQIASVVQTVGANTSDWTVSSDYAAPVMVPGVTHDIDGEPWSVKADESEQ